MDRLACIDLPALALQLLLKRRPQWEQLPVVIVEEDHPQGVILDVNEHARRMRILPGMRYAAALALNRDVRATVVPSEEIRSAVETLTVKLRRFSPYVEASASNPGVFWLSGAGLRGLYDSVNSWAQALSEFIAGLNLSGSVCAGFTRFGSFAVARSRGGVTLFRDPDAEREAAREVPLTLLDIEPAFRDTMTRLGVHTLGALCDLPAAGVQERYGSAAARLHRLARGDLSPPLELRYEPEPVRRTLYFDEPVDNALRLLFILKSRLPAMLNELRDRGEALAALCMQLRFDRDEPRLEELRLAEPTLEERVIVDLARLRLDTTAMVSGVIELELEAVGRRVAAGQVQLFGDRPRRDLAAANRALARVRAEFGNNAVRRAEIREGHLPEARSRWVPLERLEAARPLLKREPRLIRRLLVRPQPLTRRPRRRSDDGWLARGVEHGPVERLVGPWIISGGWWQRRIHREYHFAETRRGDILWVYFDGERQRWFLHGTVE